MHGLRLQPGKCSKDAKETVQECTTQFLLFVTSEAQELSATDGRRTITAEDILTAMKKLGFDQYYEMAKWYHQKMLDVKNGADNKNE